MLLTHSNIDVNVIEEHHRTPLYVASESRHKKEVVEMLLAETNVKVNAQDTNGNTSLPTASKHYHQNIVDILLAVSSNDNAKHSHS